LNQACADAPRSKTLGKENFLQLHVCVSHGRIVARQLKPADYRPTGNPAFKKTPAQPIIFELATYSPASSTAPLATHHHPPDD
jgi:hypothetical protein